MKDQKYDIVDTVTNGDCFFDAIRLALEQIKGESTTVRKLRKIIADEKDSNIKLQAIKVLGKWIEILSSKNNRINETNRNKSNY